MPRVVLALFSGALLCLAHPDVSWWFVAPIAFAGFAWALRGGVRARHGFGVGFVGGLAFFVPTLSWAGIYVGSVPWFALATLQALFVGLFGALATLTNRAPGRVAPVHLALAWVVAEYLRSISPYGGFPWVKLAFSQVDGPYGRLASIGGPALVSFAVVCSGGLLALLARDLVRRARSHRGVAHRSSMPPTSSPRPAPQVRGGVARAWGTAASMAALALIGLAVPLPTDGPAVSVLGVQGNVPRPGLDFNAERRAVLDDHVRATYTAAAEVRAGRIAQPSLVVWPENASDIDPLRNADANDSIRAATNEIDAPLIVGGLLEEPPGEISNASLLFLPGQPGPGDTQRYIKRHPVPFAEYIPQRDFYRLFSDKVDLVSRNFAAGDRVGVMTVDSPQGQIRAGLAICFEVAYDDIMRDTIVHGANLLVVQTNNATFGYTNESAQQLSISRFRAMELGRSVLHVSTVGQSALITPDGVAHQVTELFEQALVHGDLPLRTEVTLAARLGVWPEWLASAVVLMLMIRATMQGRAGRTRRGPTAPVADETKDVNDDFHAPA